MSESNSSKSGLTFHKVDVDTMPEPLKVKYAALVKANAAAKVARDAFEAAFTAQAKKMERIDGDVELAFGYKYGVAIAKRDKDAPKKTSAKPKFSF